VSCERVRRLLGVYGELDRPERRTIAQHLRDCAECRAHWAEELQVRALVHSVPVLEPPRGLQDRLLAIPSGPARGPGPRVAPWLTVAGAAILLGLVTGVGQVTRSADTASGVGGSVSVQAALPTVVPRLAGPLRPTAAAGPTAPTDLAAPARPVAAARRAPGGRISAGLLPVPGSDPARTPTAEPRGAVPAGDASSGGDSEPAGGAAASDGQGETRPATLAPPTEPACVVVTVLAFADLAGTGTLGCPGCDGLWTPADAAAAAAAGVALPPLQVSVYDPAQEDLVVFEGVLQPDGAMAELTLTDCLRPGMRVQIKDPAGAWSPCPAVGAPVRVVAGQGPITLTFPLTAGCPAPVPEPSATDLADPMVGGSATPTTAPPLLGTPAP
jgi:hypothetical protein